MIAQATAVLRNANARRLRVGIAVHSLTMPAWQHLALTKISQCDRVTIAALISLEPVPDETRLRDLGLLRKLFEWHEGRRYVRGHLACELKDAAPLLQCVPTYRLPALPRSGSLERRRALDEIGACSLDVIVLLGSAQPIDDLCVAARFGVWHYEHDVTAAADATGRSVGLWEVMTRKPCVKSILKAAVCNERQERIIHVSYSAIDHCSFTRTRSEHLWKGASFLSRKLRELAEDGWDALAPVEAAGVARTQSDSEAVPSSPGRLRWAAAFFLYALWRLYKAVTNRLYRERWVLLFDFGDRKDDFSTYRKLIPPPDRYWADPHVVHRDGGYYVFLEEMPLATRRGHISVMRRQEDGTFSAPLPVIQRPYHLSFPSVFDWRGELFLIPESSEHRTIEVYRCKRFPEEWELECVLMEDVAAVDSTLVEHDGRWWLFTNIRENEGAAWDELFLFSAEIPLGRQWQAHARNPIISDVRRARLAGGIYSEGGQLYRPSQDGSYRYGYGLRLNRIVELTMRSYREELVSHFEPGWDSAIRGIHSFSRQDALTVVDGIYCERRPRAVRVRPKILPGPGKRPDPLASG